MTAVEQPETKVVQVCRQCGLTRGQASYVRRYRAEPWCQRYNHRHRFSETTKR